MKHHRQQQRFDARKPAIVKQQSRTNRISKQTAQGSFVVVIELNRLYSRRRTYYPFSDDREAKTRPSHTPRRCSFDPFPSSTRAVSVQLNLPMADCISFPLIIPTSAGAERVEPSRLVSVTCYRKTGLAR